MASLKLTSLDAGDVRAPAPAAGTAIAVARYKQERFYIMHPDDFHRLSRIADALDDLAPPIEHSALLTRAHEIEETPSSTPLESPEALAQFLAR